jgi:hypothetical protein
MIDGTRWPDANIRPRSGEPAEDCFGGLRIVNWLNRLQQHVVCVRRRAAVARDPDGEAIPAPASRRRFAREAEMLIFPTHCSPAARFRRHRWSLRGITELDSTQKK